MKPLQILAVSLIVVLSFAPTASAADGDWQALFNGQDFSGWQSAGGGEPSSGWVVEDGTIVRKERGGYVWSKGRYGDFVLDLEFMTQGNSGIFIRTDDMKNCVQTGIEVAINKPVTQPNTHSTGALYDLVAPCKPADKPAGQWNQIVITAKDNLITVVLNGEKVVEADLDHWTKANQNPDGSGNKFNTALKDFKREGHIGFQDHGSLVAFRNVRIKRL
jgi:hypothetical protein